jgi:predicted Fe-Mo cluster-binding NifX family protein
MCIALATFGDKIAALFESSTQFVIFKSVPNKTDDSEVIPIKNNSPNELLNLLKQHDVKIVICGAISGCTRRLLIAHNIQVIPWITGDVTSVIKAFRFNRLITPSFVMPGCRANRRQGRGHLGRGKQNLIK